MKKISLLKKLGIGLGAVAAAAPLVLTATSCSKESAVTSHYISFKSMYENEGRISSLKRSHFSHDELLLGCDDFSNGNYILFVGSNTFANSRTFFASEDCPTKDLNLWLTEYFDQSIWYNDVHNYPNKLYQDSEFKKFSFVTFIDNFDFKFYDKNDHRYYVCEDANKGLLGVKQDVSPFETWTEPLIVNTKAFMRDVYDYDWDDEAVEEGDYIRQDKQAKAYRSFCERGQRMFPTSDDRKQTFVTDATDGSVMAIYKGGKLQEIVTIPVVKNTKTDDEKLKDKDTATLLGTINKYFANIEDDPE